MPTRTEATRHYRFISCQPNAYLCVFLGHESYKHQQALNLFHCPGAILRHSQILNVLVHQRLKQGVHHLQQQAAFIRQADWHTDGEFYGGRMSGNGDGKTFKPSTFTS